MNNYDLTNIPAISERSLIYDCTCMGMTTGEVSYEKTRNLLYFESYIHAAISGTLSTEHKEQGDRSFHNMVVEFVVLLTRERNRSG